MYDGGCWTLFTQQLLKLIPLPPPPLMLNEAGPKLANWFPDESSVLATKIAPLKELLPPPLPLTVPFPITRIIPFQPVFPLKLKFPVTTNSPYPVKLPDCE